MNKAAECGLCFFQVVRVEPALDPGEQPIQQSDHVAAPQCLHVTLHLAARAQLLQFPRHQRPLGLGLRDAARIGLVNRPGFVEASLVQLCRELHHLAHAGLIPMSADPESHSVAAFPCDLRYWQS
ncbi:hypothetical protein [Thiomonas sp.]|uniref:hypothetical protein n=1 Tax=Thiomonas sp. TaxID=2047785 RepID=UPI00258F9019|nr:hypothetical protein [Thiomonas sp.]